MTLVCVCSSDWKDQPLMHLCFPYEAMSQVYPPLGQETHALWTSERFRTPDMHKGEWTSIQQKVQLRWWQSKGWQSQVLYCPYTALRQSYDKQAVKLVTRHVAGITVDWRDHSWKWFHQNQQECHQAIIKPLDSLLLGICPRMESQTYPVSTAKLFFIAENWDNLNVQQLWIKYCAVNKNDEKLYSNMEIFVNHLIVRKLYLHDGYHVTRYTLTCWWNVLLSVWHRIMNCYPPSIHKR